MKYVLIFGFLTICSFYSFSQKVYHSYLQYYPVDTSGSLNSKSYLLLQSDISVNSNAATNRFISAYAFGGYIDNEMKDEVQPRLRQVNRYGFEFNSSLTGKVNKDSTMAFLAGLSLRQLNTAVFSSDAFNLMFRGNKMFAGKTAHLTPLNFLSFDYQSIFLGLEKKQKNLKWWAGLAGIRGGNFRSINVERGLFYTGVDGAFVEADANFDIALSGGAPSAVSVSHGTGLAAFAGADYTCGNSQFGVSISDLGFIKWNNLKTYSGDSVYRFEGKEIKNILTIDDSLYSSYTADSLTNEVGVAGNNEKKSYFLPTRINLNYVYYGPGKLFFITGAEIVLNAGYLPRVYLRPVYRISKNIFAHVELAAGGYGRLDAEFGVAGYMGYGFSGFVNIFAAEAIIAPSRTSGQGLEFALIKTF